ncbi:MAG: 4-hydroxy-3-methylbut-2-enyl diphosphate reductase [Christensenellaceae bacterium]|jgi:4-hydroxy-3-methylbut-2-enyl diphosphate reductase|nr:4-hydroxy-3-methylbut-2-enyl diphosphate reductase [Christensenellaceae bacterium]
MRLLIPKDVGFCSGVSRAIELAKNAASMYGQVYTYGPLIHNEMVVKKLESQGIVSISEPSELKRNDTVIIRSHGVDEKTIAMLEEIGCRIVDATCQSVACIHRRVSSFSNRGGFVFVFGKKDHPEVIGICSRCKAFEVISDIEKFTFPANYTEFLIVAQTTFDSVKYAKYTEIIKEMAINTSKTVEIFNSICYTTIARQSVARKITLESDIVIVVGDRNSSNTQSLCNIARRFCKETYLISDPSELQSISYAQAKVLGIIAGASTPRELIMEVVENMEENNKDVVITGDEELVEVAETEIVSDEVSAKSEEPIVEVQSIPEAHEESKVTVTERVPSKKAIEKSEFEKQLQGYDKERQIREGMRLKVRVIKSMPSGVEVVIDGVYGKNDSGFIDKTEMELDGSYSPDAYPEGTELDAVAISKTDPKMKGVNLSKRLYDAIKIEDEAVKTILQGEEFTLACTQAIKGGLLGKLGSYSIFVPASQIKLGFAKNLEEFIGKKLRLRILPPKDQIEEDPENGSAEAEGDAKPAKRRKQNPKRIVASQRIILEEEINAREEAFWNIMKVNNIVEGRVKRFVAFGAFISIMGHDCLAHISDLSWSRINDPSEVIELNKVYEFVVLKVDSDTNKVSLGYKQLLKKPITLYHETHSVGDVVTGTVSKIKDFGAFINLAPGVDGLIHLAEIGHKWISNVNEALKIGQEVTTKIISFDNDRITLSLKALEEISETPSFENKDETPQDDKSTNKKSFSKKFDKPDRPSADNKSDVGSKQEKASSNDKKKKFTEKSDQTDRREYTSKSGATLADLFKDLDMNKFDDNPNS